MRIIRLVFSFYFFLRSWCISIIFPFQYILVFSIEKPMRLFNESPILSKGAKETHFNADIEERVVTTTTSSTYLLLLSQHKLDPCVDLIPRSLGIHPLIISNKMISLYNSIQVFYEPLRCHQQHFIYIYFAFSCVSFSVGFRGNGQGFFF